MKRVVEEEWLDVDAGEPQEIDAALHSISLANHRFGGERLHLRLLQRVLERITDRTRPPQILEVASGRADVLRQAIARLGVTPEVFLLDRSAAHLPRPDAWPANLPTPQLHVGDALALPFADSSVDIVSCCLFLHHLEPPQIARFFAEAQRVARVAVVINDLERTAVHYRLAQLNRLIDASRISRHDGPASVRRAYTHREFVRMLTDTGCTFSLERAFLFRLGAILWCR
jgi:ubiquinone/menaquinone biosynthesis C-methylase UbiE